MPRRKKAFTVKPKRGEKRKPKRLVNCKPTRTIRGKKLKLLGCLGGRSDKTKGKAYAVARMLREEGFGSIYMIECKYKSKKTGRWLAKQCLYGKSKTKRLKKLLKEEGMKLGLP